MKNTKDRFYEIAEHLAMHNIDPVLGCKVELADTRYYFDLHTRAKSDLLLFDDLSVEGRYGYKSKLEGETLSENIRELCYEFKNCLHGRDYGSCSWFALCEKLDI